MLLFEITRPLFHTGTELLNAVAMVIWYAVWTASELEREGGTLQVNWGIDGTENAGMGLNETRRLYGGGGGGEVEEEEEETRMVAIKSHKREWEEEEEEEAIFDLFRVGRSSMIYGFLWPTLSHVPDVSWKIQKIQG